MKKIIYILKEARHYTYLASEMILDAIWVLTHKEENAQQIADLKGVLASIDNSTPKPRKLFKIHRQSGMKNNDS